MKPVIYLILSVFLFVWSCDQQNPVEKLREDVKFLSSDSLKGREVGTPGEKLAAEYIANKFEQIGLVPAGTDGFFQTFFVKTSNNPHVKPEVGGENDGEGITGYNVLGKIDNPGDKVIVIGAHFDHLGMGGMSSLDRSGPAIHNGADDNASGTAALLQLARELNQMDLQKDILLFAISGEEQGLWGSNYYVKNPTIELSDMHAMINMDMVGRLDTTRGLAINGVGTSPLWSEVLLRSNTDNIKTITSESGVGPSDHTSFYLQDVPVLHLFTGQHEDYHKPTDAWDKVNYEGLYTVEKLVKNMIIELDKQEAVVFTKTKDESGSTPRFSVTLGVVPDYLYDGEGMRIDGVSEEKPAIKAGIQKGDIVVQMGDSTITDMMSYMRALSGFNKGDSTDVIIDRNGERKIFNVIF
jgi:Zn-dependent M28 family amino/carboxypeptidase